MNALLAMDVLNHKKERVEILSKLEDIF